METLEFIQFSPNVSGEALFEFMGKISLATGDRIVSVVVGGFDKDIQASFSVDDDYITVGCYLPPIIGRTYYAELEVEEIIEENQTKGGAKRARLLRIIPIITPTLTQRVAFGILCAKHVCKKAVFISWADKWISGKDRSKNAAEYAANAAAVYAANAAEYAEYASKDKPKFNLHVIAVMALRDY